MYTVDPCSSCPAQTLSLPSKLSMDPSLPICWHWGKQAQEVTAPAQSPLAHTNTHLSVSPRHHGLSSSYPGPPGPHGSQLFWWSHTQQHTYLMAALKSGSQDSYPTCWPVEFDIC